MNIPQPRPLQRGLWIALVPLLAAACAHQPPPPPAPTAQIQPEFAPAEASPNEETPIDDGARSLSSFVRKVTVYSDRALVTREARTELSDEPTTFAFRGLPGWVDDGSVRVSSSSGKILDVRVQRDFLASATDQNYKRAEEAHQDLTYQMNALNDEIAILDAQQAQIQSIEAFSREKLSTDTVRGNTITLDSYGKVVNFIGDSLRETAAARRKVQREKSRLLPKIQASQKTLNELQNLAKLEETTVLVTLQDPEESKSDLELTYMTPGATWEPVHELRADSSNQNTAEFTSYAVVTQTSGEDWTGAELYFSTQSPNEAVKIPEVSALTLGSPRTSARLVSSRKSSFTRAQNAYRDQNQFWNKLRNQDRSTHRFEQVYQDNIQYLETTQSKTVQIFQKLQKRGTTIHFKSIEPANVRGDGSSARLTIGRTRFQTTQKIVAAPEQSLNAALTLEMLNSSAQPLLPGQVALYHDGAFLGMTDINFIADGERFPLFFNVADQIKLSRRLDKEHSSLVRKKRNRMNLAFVVAAENLSRKPLTLTLVDRIPVSKNREIKVDNIKVEPNTKPDTQGILTWDITLAPGEKRNFQISYRVEYPPTLILETERKRRMKKQYRRHAPNIGNIAPGLTQEKSYNFEDQIMDLESNF